MRSFVASRIGETQLYLQSFLERSAAGKQAAGGGNTQVDLPGSTGRDCSPSILILDPSRACWRGVMSVLGH
jgi:hypothetical protein